MPGPGAGPRRARRPPRTRGPGARAQQQPRRSIVPCTRCSVPAHCICTQGCSRHGMRRRPHGHVSAHAPAVRAHARRPACVPLTRPARPPCAPARAPTDMDGFKLLETVGLELDLPVISESLGRVSPDYAILDGAAAALQQGPSGAAARRAPLRSRSRAPPAAVRRAPGRPQRRTRRSHGGAAPLQTRPRPPAAKRTPAPQLTRRRAAHAAAPPVLPQ